MWTSLFLDISIAMAILLNKPCFFFLLGFCCKCGNLCQSVIAMFVFLFYFIKLEIESVKAIRKL